MIGLKIVLDPIAGGWWCRTPGCPQPGWCENPDHPMPGYMPGGVQR